MVEFQLPKGMRDISPEESAAAEAVRAAFLEMCKLFDYRVMEPSSLELVETLEAKSGPSIQDEIYLLREKGEGGRELGLRFDLTVGITRYVASKRNLSPPIRFGSYSSVWRYDNPQYGRYRWFYQWDAELFGPSNSESDAEVVEFAFKLFRKLGASPEIRINSRKIVEQFVRNQTKIEEPDRILAIMRAIDKIPKKGFDQVASEYVGTVVNREQFETIRNLMDISAKEDVLSEISSQFKIETTKLVEMTDSLKRRGVPDFKIDVGIVRGIDYYTDMVFEAYDKKTPGLGSLCGGGRYDSLPAIYGRPDLGATGVAGGVERAILAYRFERNEIKLGYVFVAPVGTSPKVQEVAEQVASKLRDAGIPAQSEITGRSLKKVLDMQSSAGTKVVVIIGERELQTNSAKIRWMKTGQEELVGISELERTLRQN